MALTNAEKQKRWRERRNSLASSLEGDAIAQSIFNELGAKKTQRVVDLLRKRLKRIDPNCSLCNGTGVTPVLQLRGPCGFKEGELAMQCPCTPEFTEHVRENDRRRAAGEDTASCELRNQGRG
jgi:hypothetical protein